MNDDETTKMATEYVRSHEEELAAEIVKNVFAEFRKSLNTTHNTVEKIVCMYERTTYISAKKTINETLEKDPERFHEFVDDITSALEEVGIKVSNDKAIEISNKIILNALT